MNWDMLGAIAETAGAFAVVVSLIYLIRQVAASNRLAKAEASRAPNSDLNMLNASFGTHPPFRTALRRAIQGEERAAFDPDDRVLLDLYLVSITNLYEQLLREVQAGTVDENALDFGAKGMFELPFYRTSWPIFRPFLSASFVDSFEERYSLDAGVDTVY